LVVPGDGVFTVRLIGLSKVWLWAVPALVVFACAGIWRHRGNTYIRLLLASALLTLLGYLFVPFDQGHGWGFRYFHSAWFVLPIFAAAAFAGEAEGNREFRGGAISSEAAYLHATALCSLVVLTGYFAWQVHGFIARHLAQLPHAASGVPRVVIVDAAWGYYAYDLVQNDPFLRSPVVMMISHGREQDQQALARHYPGLVKLGGDYRGSVWGTPAPPL
jgi:hypothetical protein